MKRNYYMKKEAFKQLLIESRRENVSELILSLESLGFFMAPASIRHQNNYDGGLMDHSLSVYDHALKIRQEQISQNPELEKRLPLESISIVCLLHDVCKSDIYRKTAAGRYFKDLSAFPCGHGEKSVIMLLRMGLELTEDEILAIRWHMGVHEAKEGSQEYANMKVAQRKSPLLRLLRMADSRASAEALRRF